MSDDHWGEIVERGRQIRIAIEEAQQLRDENAMLRQALERIADTDPDEGTQWFHDVARTVLEKHKEQK